MIKTRRVKLTPAEYFKILVEQYIRKRWWLIVWILILAIILALQNNYETFEYFFFAIAIMYPILLAWQLWNHANSKENKLLFMERHYEIDDKKINGIIDEESYSPMKLEYFIKVKIIRNKYLLYLAKNQFIFIPIDSFESSADLEWFKSEIISKIKK